MRRNIEDFPPVMTAAQVAEFLGVSKPTAYEVMKQTGFPSFKLNKVERGNVRVWRDDLVKWIKEQLNNQENKSA